MRRLLASLSCLLLAACITVGKRGTDSAMVSYDFGPVAASLLGEARRQPLAVEVRAPMWFDTRGIDYRLLYAEPARLREYARARWAGPPTQLIEQRLAQQLELSMAGRGQASCLLQVEITEFSQLFSSPDSSRGVLQGRALLLDHSRRQLADLDLHLEQAAPGQDAAGGVAALTATVTRLAVDLLAWEKRLIADGKAGDCSG